jgi:hypothetical protein
MVHPQKGAPGENPGIRIFSFQEKIGSIFQRENARRTLFSIK